LLERINFRCIDGITRGNPVLVLLILKGLLTFWPEIDCISIIFCVFKLRTKPLIPWLFHILLQYFEKWKIDRNKAAVKGIFSDEIINLNNIIAERPPFLEIIPLKSKSKNLATLADLYNQGLKFFISWHML